MEDFLRQMIGMAPGLGQAAMGNGPQFAAFMQGFERARQADEQRKRMAQQDAIAMEDRSRQMGRQDTADANAAQDRTQQQALRSLQIPGHLAELGATADDPQGAQAMIEAAMPKLMAAFGPDTMAMGQPAVEMAQRAITGRQKKQVEAFVEAALKTSFVADNPDADPEMTNLPEHIAKIVGKPSARLSELQSYAQLPVGKPAGKTRVPAAAGSFEEYSDPTTPPERKAQIEADRKKYMQADDRAPRVTVNTGDGIDRSAALKFQDDYARDSKPYITMREAYQRVRSAASKPDAAGDLSMIFAYMKMLDPNSVVREQEFANAQNAAGVPDRIRNVYNRVMQGNRLAPEQRAQFVAQAESLFENAKTNQRGVRGTYGKRAKDWKIPEGMVLDEEDEFLRAPSGPPVGERRKAPDGSLVEWDGEGWKPVRF